MACRLIDNRLRAIRYSTICDSNYLSRRCIAFAFVSCHQNNSKELSCANFHEFLQRDAMRQRGLCCRPVSVFPSVTFVYCIQTAEDIVKLLCRPGSSPILDWWGVQLATNNYVFVVRRTTLRIQEYLQKFIPQQDTGNSTNVAVDEFNVKVLRSELIRLSVAPCKLFSSMTLCLFLNPDFKLFLSWRQ